MTIEPYCGDDPSCLSEADEAAIEYREAEPAPKRLPPGGDPPRKFKLARSTVAAIDWLIRWKPDAYEGFLTGRSHEELSLIEAYLEEKRGPAHGR